MNAKPKPRYQQLKDLIITRISSGELGPNDRVPSENELVESMSVSRMTANRALRELTDEGYVERIAGRGTFVSDFRSRSHVLEVHNIADEIQRRGRRHSCDVIRISRQHARGEVARALHVDQGVDVFHLLLVHHEDGTPIQVEDRHILAEFAPGCAEQDFHIVTPSAYLTAISPLQEAEQIVRAQMPDAAMRTRLQIPDTNPASSLFAEHGHTAGRLHLQDCITRAAATSWPVITYPPEHPSRRRPTSYNWRIYSDE